MSATLSDAIRMACVWEASARKPGNVHLEAPFDDLTWHDFVEAAEAAAPVLAEASALGVGPAVLEAVRATRSRIATNANLGIILLLAPLAAVPESVSLKEGISRVLDCLTVQDAEAVYEAIRLANPGGLGQATEQDVSAQPTITLHEAMALAADRDLIARQYVTNFATVFDGAERFSTTRPGFGGFLEFLGLTRRGTPPGENHLLPARIETGIIQLHLELMAAHPDSLIARKCGREVAEESARRAAQVLASGTRPRDLASFDQWLRADGHRRNPGTTADLVAACLFVQLRELPLAT